MKLFIDNKPIDAQPGQSLRELIAALGLLACFIAVRPWRKFFKKPAEEEIGYDA